MKKIIIIVLTEIMWLWSKLYTYKLSQACVRLKSVVYTAWIKNFLGYVGQHSSMYHPCLLQGGGQKCITIGNNTTIQSHCILGCWEKYGEQQFTPSINIGDNCNIGEYNHITSCNKITIGNGLLTGRFVYIGDNAHGGLSWEESDIPPANRNLTSKGEISIGNDVWIGDKVTILSGVHIGNNVIIGANSVVTHDLPSNCVAVGMPAKIVKQL